MSSSVVTNYTISRVKSPPMVGMLLRALRDPLGFVMDFSQRYGDIITFNVMGHTTVQLNHPDLIQYVLVENHKNYRKSKPYIRFESAIGQGLLTSNGEKWKRDRQKIQPMFNRERIMGYYYEVTNEVTEKYKRKWLNATEHGAFDVDINAEMAKITTEIILKSIFGKEIDDGAVTSLHHSYGVLIEYLRKIRILSHVDFRKMFHTPAYFRFKKELDNIDSRLCILAQQYRSAGLTDPRNMLALLVAAQKDNPDHFSDKDIRDHCVSMVFAGFESTSILMQWFWYMLDDQPDVTRKLREDITQHAPCTAADDSSALSYESVQKMAYLSMVLKETMRLYPPFWMTGREPIEDDTIGGLKITKGTTIILPQIALHRHPRWWQDPNNCIPERFSPENEPCIMDGLYSPFSLGPRKCSGHSFVDMEAKTIIAKLLPMFEVTALNKNGNPMRPGISLKLKYPLMVRISRRVS